MSDALLCYYPESTPKPMFTAYIYVSLHQHADVSLFGLHSNACIVELISRDMLGLDICHSITDKRAQVLPRWVRMAHASINDCPIR